MANALSSMKPFENLFVFQNYFNKSLNEIGLKKPDFEQAARTLISSLCSEIISLKRDSFEVTKDIFEVIIDLERPVDLSVWIELDDYIDRIIFDDEYFKPNESDVRQRIHEESKNYLAVQESNCKT